ncbi:GTP cyclohydrolase 1 feedback regulatory protein-like isoform X2 [Dreissena polymorpha]|uniref:GTP cyclohydrolase 1 feedback regulatory protein-like isoform X2 n=1 Tax=Dreissena polymorpha TaxID=45954 RepID=UPI002263E564|nr:GTP cyclohydrolase 1 feedback regulatory protein-like isoform X2 [Dreissena polymorpha]
MRFAQVTEEVEISPTIVDGYLNARDFSVFGAKYGKNAWQATIKLHPSLVLDKLEELGYRMVSSACNDKMMMWTMHAPPAMKSIEVQNPTDEFHQKIKD